MKDQYFYQDRGQTQGPIDIDEVRERIKDGRLNVFDLVYRDGEDNWRMALEHSALRSEFSTTSLAAMREKPWVLLKGKPSGEKVEFSTSGPFSDEFVREGLQSGDISYSDYAWKDGFSDWKRIGALEEFNPRVRTAPAGATVKPTPEPSARELVRNVVEFKRPTLQAPEPPPPEAKTADLTKKAVPELPKVTAAPSATPPPIPKASEKPEKKAKSEKVESKTFFPRLARKSKAQPEVEPKIEAKPERVERRKKKRNSRWAIDWGLVGVLALALAGVVIITSRFVIPRSHVVAPQPIETAPPEAALPAPPAPEEPPFGAAPPTAAATGNPTAPSPGELPGATTDGETAAPPGAATEEPPEQAPAVKAKPPTELVLNVTAVSANQARIEIRADSAPEYPIYVQVVGLPGQVSEGGAFYRFQRYTPTGNAQQPLDLSQLKLPQGKFILRAETGTLKREAKFTMGAGDPAYKAAVTRQRKMWAHAIWKERLQLFPLAQLLEKQIAAGLIPTKKFSAKGLDALVGVKRVNGAKYFLFEDWWELHQIVKEAKTSATAALLARAQKERDRLATFSVWK